MTQKNKAQNSGRKQGSDLTSFDALWFPYRNISGRERWACTDVCVEIFLNLCVGDNYDSEVRLFCLDYFWGKILLKFLTHATFYLDSIISSLKFLESHRLLTLICNYNSTGAWMGSWDGLGAVEKRVIFWPSFCRFLGRQYGGLVALLTGLSSSLNEFLLLAISNL